MTVIHFENAQINLLRFKCRIHYWIYRVVAQPDHAITESQFFDIIDRTNSTKPTIKRKNVYLAITI